jgi:hypothetical protein
LVVDGPMRLLPVAKALSRVSVIMVSATFAPLVFGPAARADVRLLSGG